MTSSELKEITDWFDQRSKELRFGEVSVVAKIHEGEITLIEKHLKTNCKPRLDGAGGGHGQRRNFS